jgi:hypothetical protein
MARVDPVFYANVTTPTATRRSSIPLHGFPLEKQRLSHNKITDPYHRVHNTQGFGSSKIGDADADAGKYYYIHIDAYATLPDTIRVIEEVSPILANPTKFDPGAYYTYVMASIVGTDPETNKIVVLSQSQSGVVPQLYATRAINMYEFGTKHHQIMYRKANQDQALFADLSKSYKNIKYRLYAAGEIRCVNETTLIFNFLSGTYKMKRHITARRAKYEQAYIVYMMRIIAPEYTDIVFQQDALIMDATVPLTTQELSRLRRRDVPLFMLDTQNQCNYMKNAIIQHMRQTKIKNPTYDEMRKIYLTIKYENQ